MMTNMNQKFNRQLAYSAVSNKRAASNKQAGWKFSKILISEQSLRSKQDGNFMKFY